MTRWPTWFESSVWTTPSTPVTTAIAIIAATSRFSRRRSSLGERGVEDLLDQEGRDRCRARTRRRSARARRRAGPVRAEEDGDPAQVRAADGRVGGPLRRLHRVEVASRPRGISHRVRTRQGSRCAPGSRALDALLQDPGELARGGDRRLSRARPGSARRRRSGCAASRRARATARARCRRSGPARAGRPSRARAALRPASRRRRCTVPCGKIATGSPAADQLLGPADRDVALAAARDRAPRRARPSARRPAGSARAPPSPGSAAAAR